MLFESLVLSYFSCYAPIYKSAIEVETSNIIQRVLNSSIRFIYCIRKYKTAIHKLKKLHCLNMKSKREEYKRAFHKLKEFLWLNMKSKRDVQSLILYRKILITKQPTFWKNTFQNPCSDINIRFCKLIPAHLRTFL